MFHADVVVMRRSVNKTQERAKNCHAGVMSTSLMGVLVVVIAGYVILRVL